MNSYLSLGGYIESIISKVVLIGSVRDSMTFKGRWTSAEEITVYTLVRLPGKLLYLRSLDTVHLVYPCQLLYLVTRDAFWQHSPSPSSSRVRGEDLIPGLLLSDNVLNEMSMWWFLSFQLYKKRGTMMLTQAVTSILIISRWLVITAIVLLNINQMELKV